MQVLRRLNTIHLLLLGFGALLTLCAWQAGGPDEILGTLPALLLAVALAFNRFPGEELIARLAEHFRRPRARAISVGPPAHVVFSVQPRLLLLAGSRQLRAPPRLV